MIQFRAISKSFAGHRVLRDVSFSVPTGHTLGLVGENGAGKSTLMNLLGGNLRPDSGAMQLNGQPYAPQSPLDASRQGIAFIHQELNLFPNLSIGENIFLTAFPKAGGRPWIDRGKLHRQTHDLLEQVGLTHPADTKVERLSAGERQLVEIAKAVSLDARLMILDEPTTSLSAREAERLFALMARLRQRGLSMIYISHTLGDVLRLCDDIVVLRNGAVVGAGPRAGFTAERMISLMVGRSHNRMYPTRTRGAGSAERRHPDLPQSASPCQDATTPKNVPILEARHLTQPGIVCEINFALHRGEVLGIFGLMGAGRSELARILFALDPCERGEVFLNGEPIQRVASRRRIERGLAFLTENRREEGLCLQAAISDNVALVSLGQHARRPLGLLNFGGLRKTVATIREAVRLTPTARDQAPAATLSGGNQQKVVLAKWLLAKPRVLILDEPTRGIDVGAKYEIYQLILQLADSGTGVLVISSELEELIGICDRILVMSHGEIRDELRREEFDRGRILAAALRDVKTPAPNGERT
jgi:ribose transport system ATP-binding protein